MTSKHKIKNNIWLGGIAGFLLGISGNLIASWIQQEILGNSFTPIRIGLILLCSLAGIVFVAFLEKAKEASHIIGKSSKSDANLYSRIRLAWSKLKTRGKGINMEDVSAIGSDIDIDTK